MSNLAKKFQMGNAARLSIAHSALVAKNYHVESVEFGKGVIIASVVNEADQLDEYHDCFITIREMVDFVSSQNLNICTVDGVDSNGEQIITSYELNVMDWLGENKNQAVKQFLDAGKGEKQW